MSHRAALYTVRVRKLRSKDFTKLGDYDEVGTYLGDTLAPYLQNLEVPNEEGTKVVICESATLSGEELEMKLRHGESGVAAVITDEAGAEAYRQRPSDTQLLTCAGLFVLPSQDETGYLALHVNANRGVKGLLGNSLAATFMQHHDDHRLEIEAFVHRGALEQAIDEGKVNSVKLIRSVAPDDRADDVVERWLPPQEWGKIVVEIEPKGRGKRVQAALLKKFVHGDTEARRAAFPEIVEFAGMSFDEAKVEVELENKTVRTFNIEKPDSGHPFTLDLDPAAIGVDATGGDGQPDHDKLIDALRAALGSVL